MQAVIQPSPQYRLLSEKRVEIEDYLRNFTVSLWMMNPGDAASNNTRNGSGVLVNIDGGAFILTAGHCVELWRGASDGKTVVLCHEPTLTQKVTRHEKGEDRDFGYLMLEPTALQDLQYVNKSFLPLTAIHLDRPGKDEDVLISGYPEFQRRSDIYGRHVHVQGGCTHSGYKPLRDFFSAWIDAENISRAFCVTDAPDQDYSSGVSGGGCWTPNFPADLETWGPELMQLCAIHYHAGYTTSVRRMDEMPVSNHLQLIADTVPGIEAVILHQWPEFRQR